MIFYIFCILKIVRTCVLIVLHQSRGGKTMDYKEEIKKIVDSIDDQTILKLLYNFAQAGLKEEEQEKTS